MHSLKDIFNNKKDKWDFIIALIVIFLFILYFYKLSFRNTEDDAINIIAALEKPQIESKVNNKEISNELKKQYSYKKTNAYELKTIKAENAYETIKDSAIVISDIIKSETIAVEMISNPTNDNTINPSNTKTKVTDTKTIDVSKGNLKVSDTITLKKPSIPTEEKKEEEKLPKTTSSHTDKKVNTLLNTETDCIAIVGVFKVESNKTAIIKQLTSHGYNHSEGFFKKGLHYVGVPVACHDKQEKRKLLIELNKIFGISSWVKKLSPTIH